MKIYDKEIQQIMRSKAPWPGLVIDVVEYPDYPGLLVLRCYESNYKQFNTMQQQDLSIYVSNLMEKIKALGLQCGVELV